MRAFIACALGLFSIHDALAMEVKGLNLGAQTSLKALSRQFGHADCPDPQQFAQMGTVLPNLTLECHVSTTFLGLAGSATIYIDRSFLIHGLSFPIPEDQEGAVVTALEKKYGVPSSRAGDPMELDGWDDKGQKKITMSKNPCTRWRRVQDASVEICPGSVTYTYIGNATVNPNDL